MTFSLLSLFLCDLYVRLLLYFSFFLLVTSSDYLLEILSDVNLLFICLALLIQTKWDCYYNTLSLLLMQVATLIAVYANWDFARIKGCGWGWAGVIWLYSLVFYVPLDIIKFFIRYVLSGKAWLNLLENKVH